MKSKIFKKILASLLACSTVMAMSGVATAQKKKPTDKEAHTASKNPATKKAKRKVRKFKKIKTKAEKQTSYSTYLKNRPVNTWIADPELTFHNNYSIDNDSHTFLCNCSCATEFLYSTLTGGDDLLSQECCNDDFVLSITNQIRLIKPSAEYLKDCPKGKENELVNALIMWAKEERITVKKDIAISIGLLAQEGCFEEFPSEKKSDVLGALINCAEQAPSIKPDVAWAFRCLTKAGFINAGETVEEVKKLQEILNGCEISDDYDPCYCTDDDLDSDPI